MKRDEKPVLWIGSSFEDLRAFPEAAKSRAGHELHRVQGGLMPVDWRPMPTIGPGTIVIRARTRDVGGLVEHRVFTVAKFAEAVWVLHAFRKTTRKTSKRDIETGRKRYAAMLRERRESQQPPR